VTIEPIESPAAGELFQGRFRIERSLKGGMSVVHIARELESGETFALKCLEFDRDHSAESLRRFEREAETWRALGRHEHIVQALDYWRDDSRAVLQLEYIDGPALSQLLREHGAIEPLQVVAWALECCAAMAFVHTHRLSEDVVGALHRDLKPGNILISRDGRARITDFGLVKVNDDQHDTTTGRFLGTLTYASPEQFRSAKHVSRPTDIFSFGIVLYEMLTGGHPFQDESPFETAQAIQHRQPNWEPLPPPLAPILRHCLEKSPMRRYGDFEELAADLRAAAPRLATSPDTKTCGACGFRTRRPGACGVCGSDYYLAAPSRGDATTVALAKNEISTREQSAPPPPYCQCGVQFSKGERFCRGCGAAAPTCTCRCTAQNPITNVFCNACGERLHAAE